VKQGSPSHQQPPTADKPVKPSAFSPHEAVALLLKYNHAVEVIKKHKQQQQQATHNLLAMLQHYLV
jgi:hypothetical protein